MNNLIITNLVIIAAVNCSINNEKLYKTKINDEAIIKSDKRFLTCRHLAAFVNSSKTLAVGVVKDCYNKPGYSLIMAYKIGVAITNRSPIIEAIHYITFTKRSDCRINLTLVGKFFAPSIGVVFLIYYVEC